MKKHVSIFVLIIFGIIGFIDASTFNGKEKIFLKFKANSLALITTEVKNITEMNVPILIKENDPIQKMVENIQWYGQASVRILGAGKVIYIDPYLITDKDVADYIFITHSHGDHFSIDDIKKIVNNYTKIYAPKECCQKLIREGFVNCKEVIPGQSLNLDGVKVKVVPAYNIVRTFHPKEKKFVGYVLTIEGLKIYHPGDTERIPEMKAIQCDIAFMPLGQTYTMQNVEEAVNAVLDVKAKVAIPIHFGMYEGTQNDAALFKNLLKDKVQVVIKECKNQLQH
jgi:L-ascorbate metabolism protein UlaG (beta-lactamase superfamily)